MPHQPNFTAQLSDRVAVEAAARDAGFRPSRFSNSADSRGNIRAMLEAIGAGERLLVPGLAYGASDEIDLGAALDIACALIDICHYLVHVYPQHAEHWHAVDSVCRLRDAWCALVIRHDAMREIEASWAGLSPAQLADVGEGERDAALDEARAMMERARMGG